MVDFRLWVFESYFFFVICMTWCLHMWLSKADFIQIICFEYTYVTTRDIIVFWFAVDAGFYECVRSFFSHCSSIWLTEMHLMTHKQKKNVSFHCDVITSDNILHKSLLDHFIMKYLRVMFLQRLSGHFTNTKMLAYILSFCTNSQTTNIPIESPTNL